MSDGFENSVIDEANFQAEEYLSPSQQEIASEKSKEAKNIFEQIALANLVDNFVRSNGKADTKYLQLHESLSKLAALCSNVAVYPMNVAETLPFAYAMLYYDFLILTGVISEEDIEEMRTRAMSYFGQEQKIAKA